MLDILLVTQPFIQELDLIVADLLLGVARHGSPTSVTDPGLKREWNHPCAGDGRFPVDALTILTVAFGTTLFNENRLGLTANRLAASATTFVIAVRTPTTRHEREGYRRCCQNAPQAGITDTEPMI